MDLAVTGDSSVAELKAVKGPAWWPLVGLGFGLAATLIWIASLVWAVIESHIGLLAKIPSSVGEGRAPGLWKSGLYHCGTGCTPIPTQVLSRADRPKPGTASHAASSLS
jgi:hypothetical protein